MQVRIAFVSPATAPKPTPPGITTQGKESEIERARPFHCFTAYLGFPATLHSLLDAGQDELFSTSSGLDRSAPLKRYMTATTILPAAETNKATAEPAFL